MRKLYFVAFREFFTDLNDCTRLIDYRVVDAENKRQAVKFVKDAEIGMFSNIGVEILAVEVVTDKKVAALAAAYEAAQEYEYQKYLANQYTPIGDVSSLEALDSAKYMRWCLERVLSECHKA